MVPDVVVLCWLLCAIHLSGINGLNITRLFRGTGVPLLYPAGLTILDEIYAENPMSCAFECAKHGSLCMSYLYKNHDVMMPDNYCWFDAANTYAGTVATTVTGRTCQRWDSQTPHTHSTTPDNMAESTLTAADNYCRDPDLSGYAWCYTTDSATISDACDLTECMPIGANCRLYQEVRDPYRARSGFTYYS